MLNSSNDKASGVVNTEIRDRVASRYHLLTHTTISCLEREERIFSVFLVGFCINEEKVICYQLELVK